jgi:hypothetical protein
VPRGVIELHKIDNNPEVCATTKIKQLLKSCWLQSKHDNYCAMAPKNCALRWLFWGQFIRGGGRGVFKSQTQQYVFTFNNRT